MSKVIPTKRFFVKNADWQKANADWRKANADRQKADADWQKADDDWRKTDANWRKTDADWRKANADRQKANADWRKVNADWRKANADWQKANADWRKAYADFTPTLKIKVVDKPKVIKCLDAIQKLFGRGGKHWIKGSYHTAEDGFNAFCLAGAAAKANGPYENAARLVISLAIAGQLTPAKQRKVGILVEVSKVHDHIITSFNDNKKTTWADVKAVLKQARLLVKRA